MTIRLVPQQPRFVRLAGTWYVVLPRRDWANPPDVVEVRRRDGTRATVTLRQRATSPALPAGAWEIEHPEQDADLHDFLGDALDWLGCDP